MTLSDLLKSDLVNDDTKITISKPMTGPVRDVRNGNWFHDRILELHYAEINTLIWEVGNSVTVYLE